MYRKLRFNILIKKPQNNPNPVVKVSFTLIAGVFMQIVKSVYVTRKFVQSGVTGYILFLSYLIIAQEKKVTQSNSLAL